MLFLFQKSIYRRAVATAFNYWAEHTPLSFREVCTTCTSDLTVDFAYKDHKGYYCS